MNKYVIAAVIVVLIVLGWVFYQKSKTTPSLAPQQQNYPQPTPVPQDEIDQEINSIDSDLNSTNDSDFDPSNLSDTSVGM